jgi:hypothetical protein
MEEVSMEKELDEEFFHDDRGAYNYCTVPGERWNCSKIYLFEGRGYIRDTISFTGDRLYLKCRKSHRKHQPCKGRAIVVGVYNSFLFVYHTAQTELNTLLLISISVASLFSFHFHYYPP